MWQKYHLLQPLRYEPHNNRLGAQGRAFLRIEKTSILSNGYCFELLVLLMMITASPIHQSHHSYFLRVWM